MKQTLPFENYYLHINHRLIHENSIFNEPVFTIDIYPHSITFKISNSIFFR